MKKYLLVLLCYLTVQLSTAQQIRVYGRLTDRGKPLKGVLITIFEDNTFYKKFITDRKGEFRFSVANKSYLILFYKPGYEPDALLIKNHMEHDVHLYPIDQELIPSNGNADTTLARSKLLEQIRPNVAQTYLTYVYKYERSRRSSDSSSVKTRRSLVRQALAERERFKNYKREVNKRQRNNEDENVTLTQIGPDTYLLVTNTKGEKQYFKNDKPITEVTYNFETNRRYEGVLKNKRDVRRFEKYDPQKNRKK
jgi:hypothetical protein